MACRYQSQSDSLPADAAPEIVSLVLDSLPNLDELLADLEPAAETEPEPMPTAEELLAVIQSAAAGQVVEVTTTTTTRKDGATVTTVVERFAPPNRAATRWLRRRDFPLTAAADLPAAQLPPVRRR